MSYARASFRDPDARVLNDDDGRILRGLSARAARFDAELRTNGVMGALVRDAGLVASRPCPGVAPPDGWAAVIESPRVPVVSYPYEWSFGMLRDAALLTLRLTTHALERDVLLKDASAYNVLFHGARPVFVDVGSLAPYEDGTPWLAYGQFCDHFLAPLMLEAYRGIPFQPFLRSSLGGLSVSEQLAPMLSGRDLLRPAVLAHVKLRALLDARTKRLDTGARRELRRAKLPKAVVLANLGRLTRLVGRLASRASSTWADYECRNGYDAATSERKARFVEAACARVGPGALAWDVGANTGRYSRVLARHFEMVVAMDVDPGAVDRLYHDVQGTAEERAILPLVIDLMNPSPAQGWRGAERDPLLHRGRPALATYLALIHHVCLGQGVPLDEFLDLVRATSPAAVVEFVSIDDPMSQAVLATKVETHPGYDVARFRTLAAARGRILAEEALSATRTMFLLGS